MLLSFLLMLGQDVTAPAAADLAAAFQLARQGENARALDALQKIAAAEPNNRETRLWIARMHDRLGHPADAEAVYRSVWLEDPTNLDAMVGAGLAALAQEHVDGAIETLQQAEQLAPDDPDVLPALGDAYGWAGQSSRSLTYFQRTSTVAPTPAHRSALERARREHGHYAAIETSGERATAPSLSVETTQPRRGAP